MYSQNGEDDLLLELFAGLTNATLVEIGANDGITLSNSRALIEKGWSAHLVEPSPKALLRLSELYKDNDKVRVHPCAICNQDHDHIIFHESGSLISEKDTSLVSCIDENEKKRWDGLSFDQITVTGRTWNTFVMENQIKDFAFLSIDAEGMDYDILTQINLGYHNCQVVCVEWNSLPKLAAKFEAYMSTFDGFKEVHRNAENIIFSRI